MSDLSHLRQRRVALRRGLLVAFALCATLLAAPLSSQAAALPAPTVSTSGASDVTYSSAILYGEVDAHGQPTTYFFEYGPTSALGSQSPLAPAGNASSDVKVSQAVTGLEAFTTYHYRVVAAGPGGTTRGLEHTFTTPKIPLTVQITGVPNPVAFGSPFEVEGTLSGTGASAHEIVLQANPFPYTAGFKDIGNPELASADGSFSFPYLGLLENTQIRVVTVGSPEVASPVVLESVAVRVSFHVRATRRRGYVRLYGTVAPAEVGALVGFQLLAPGRSVNEGGTDVTAGAAGVSDFSRVVRLRHRGLYRALVRVNDGAHVSAYSQPILIG
jgi:hypothetical protein